MGYTLLYRVIWFSGLYLVRSLSKSKKSTVPTCRRGAGDIQATTQFTTTLYPQTLFSQVKNPTLRIRELREDAEQHKEAQTARRRAEHMRQAGTPYPRNPEAMPRAADFFNKHCLS